MLVYLCLTSNNRNNISVRWNINYSGIGRCQNVGGGGGAHRHVIYVPLVKNQYKRVVFGYMII